MDGVITFFFPTDTVHLYAFLMKGIGHSMERKEWKVPPHPPICFLNFSFGGGSLKRGGATSFY